MRNSTCQDFTELPVFLNAAMVADVLGVSASTSYALMNDPSFPSLRLGKRLVVSKDKFLEWVEAHTQKGV